MAEMEFVCRWDVLGLSAIAENFITDLTLERPGSDPTKHHW